MHILIISLIWGTVALAWDLMIGFAGLFTFSMIAFFVIGAYTSGLLTVHFNISPWFGIIAGGIFTMLVGLIVGLFCLRLKGAYIALVTFALHLLLDPLIRLGRPIGTGGSRGLLGIPTLSIGKYIFGASELTPWYYSTLILTIISLLIIWKVINSNFGKGFVALRDAEVFAMSLGINKYRNRLVLFGISAFITGYLGAFYGHYVGQISPRILGLDTFLLVMVMVIIGGMGKFPGALIGGIIVTLLNNFLRPLELYRLLAFGAIIIILILFSPMGFMGFIDWITSSIKRRLGSKKL